MGHSTLNFLPFFGPIPIVRLFTPFELILVTSLAGLINIIDPDIIVFGGGLSNEIKDLNEIKKITLKYLEVKKLNTVFSHPAHGDSSGVRGAAILSRQSSI